MTNCWLWASETKNGKAAFYNFSSIEWDYIEPSRNYKPRVLVVRANENLQKREIKDEFNNPYDPYGEGW